MKAKLFLAVTSGLFAIGLCEAILWLFAGSIYPTPFFPGDIEPQQDATFDPLIGWKLPPNVELPEASDEFVVTIRSNAQGFRSRHDFSQPTEARKVAFLGDSYTFGSGVEDEETFPSVLEASMPNTQSYNFGIGAFGVDQMWLTLRHYALPLKPDLVILSFIRYDLDRSLSSYRQDHVWRQKPTFRLIKDELVPMTLENRPSVFGRFVQQHSRLHQLWRKTEHSLSRRYAMGYRWRLNRALFEAVRDDCRQAEVPLLVVHIPINRRKPTPMFDREFADMGIEYLDLTPLMPSHADTFYFPKDRHLNAAGHQFAASAIQQRLAAMQLD